MPAKKMQSRSGLSPAERALRSRLAQLASGQPFIRGTLLDRHRRCGNPGCHCANGPGHPGLYLLLSNGAKGKRQLYIPAHLHEQVRQWVANYHKIKDLLEEISQLHWDTIQSRRE